MFKKVNKRLISFLLVLTFIVSCAALPAAAASEQNQAQISITVSNKNPQIGDTVTVTVSIDNCATMTPRIAAMNISVSFDTGCFDYVSSESVLKTNAGDITSLYYDESDTISFAYVYANSNKKTLPTSAKNIFTFKLRVKSSLTDKASATFTVNDLQLFNGKSTDKYTVIECREPIIESMTVWTKRPDLLINGTDDYKTVYDEDVTLSFDSMNVTLAYENRAAVPIMSPHNCNKNGKYTVTITKANGQKVTKIFEINKLISNISVKAGTYKTEYALGINPDYSGWVLLVTYSDGSFSEIQMDDPDITITGFQPTVPGSQRLLIKYRGESTSVNVTVTTKSVESITIKEMIKKTEYLVGDDINTLGGTLIVFFDDKTKEELPITPGMISGYDKTYVGDQTVTLTYGELSVYFNVTYFSREAVDALIKDISELDLSAITLDSGPAITDLYTRYAKLNETQKEAVKSSNMYSRLEEARSMYNLLVNEAKNNVPDTKEPAPASTASEEKEESKGSDLKIVWYIVAGIVIVSVIGGIIYFLAIYFKKKKELDDDDYYYDEDEDEDDGSLTYDDDVDDIDDDDEESAEEEEDGIDE